MEIKLLGAIEEERLIKELKGKHFENIDEVVAIIRQLENEGRIRKVATAGRLSRFAGDVFDVLELTDSKTYEQNLKYVGRVIHMGHDSITDHDYLVFAIKDVSPVIEQTIIAERFSSFTIKSRREVDFSHAGFYTPDFHDKDGNVLTDNAWIQEEYQTYMNSLFQAYTKLVEQGIPKEDARFVLPYCYHSNIIMGVDAHTLKDMIVKYTKTHLSKIQELREFGERLYAIAKEHVPYIIPEIDKVPVEIEDQVRMTIDRELLETPSYHVLPKPRLVNKTSSVDRSILISSIMRRYQVDHVTAHNLLYRITEEYPDFSKKLMRDIVFHGDKLELTQVNFQFQIPVSFAVLTHLTRHRTHDILIPEFSPTVDLSQYKIPASIQNGHQEEFERIFAENQIMCDSFREVYGICDEDLVYFTLSGNTCNVVTNMNGKALEHILSLRECTKSQWETRDMARGMHEELKKHPDAAILASLLGPTCETLGICKEGKESCGRVLALQKKD